MTAPTQDQQQNQHRPQQAQPAERQSDSSLAWLAAWLVLLHQSEQRTIAANVVTRLAPLWKILDFNDLKNTQTPWIQAVLPIVEDAYAASQQAAQRFLVDYRHANLPAAPELPAVSGIPAAAPKPATPAAAGTTDAASELQAHLADILGGPSRTTAAAQPVPTTPGHAESPAPLPGASDIGVADVAVPGESAPALEHGSAAPKVIEDTPFPSVEATVSLLGTGPGEVKKQMPAPADEAMDAGRVLSSKVAIRISVDGGRAVVRRAVELDHEAVGWARVLNVDPCYFCAMLASRGAVYKADSFKTSDPQFEGDGVAKVHDGCRCGLRPVYSHSDTRDPTAEDAWQQWKQYSQGLPGKEARKAFRRNYTSPGPPEVPRIDLHSLLVQRNELLNEGFAEDSDQVRWFDQQIQRFGAILGNHSVIDAATQSTAKATGRTSDVAASAKDTVESAAEIARRHLPALQRTVESLLARGFSESSPQVQWNRKQIARFQSALH